MSEKIRISLEAARVNAGMTQPQAAQALGVSVATLLKWEKGTTSPNIEKAIALAGLYAIPLDAINFCPRT
jgi:DNA-binding XRE family transcriptional regulator